MTAEGFMKLVEEEKGIEFIHAYRDDVDHFIGGKGNTVWYFIQKNGKTKELYLGTFENGVWKDKLVKGSGEKRKETEMPAGSTIERIVQKAYLCQDEKWVTGKTPKPIEEDLPRYHYVYGFGDKGLDVSVQYGITMAYSDLKDPEAGFHLRDLVTGDKVELPE